MQAEAGWADRARAGAGRIRDEAGQTAVVFTVFLVVLVMSAGLAIEGGRLLLERRDMQGVADAAALAAVQAIPNSHPEAQDIALDYTEERNADGAVLVSADTQSDRITVTVEGTIGSSLLGLFSIDEANTVQATATAAVRSVPGIGKALPMALMDGVYQPGQLAEIKTQNPQGPGNFGAVRLEREPPCTLSSGANDYRGFIRTSDNGGIDSCPTPIGSTIATETGNMSGPTRQGLDARIGNNADTFDDVFQLDPASGRYIVVKPDSPRVGVIPVVLNMNGSTDWPNGQSQLQVVGYSLVYIGKVDQAGNPAHTNNGRSAWVVPVDAVLPSSWSPGQMQLGDYDPNQTTPIVFRLVE